MSLAAINIVLESRFGSHLRKLLMLILADYADEAGRSWPSVETLAFRAECSHRSAQENLKILASEDLLKIYPNAGPGRAHTNLYIILFKNFPSSPNPRKCCTPTVQKPPQMSDAQTAQRGADERRPSAPEPSGTTIDPPGEREDPHPIPESILAGLLAAYPDAAPKLSRRELTAVHATTLPHDPAFWAALRRWNRASDRARGRALWPRTRLEFLQNSEEAEEHVRRWSRHVMAPRSATPPLAVPASPSSLSKEEVSALLKI